jgi:phosphate transport system substrate-binding protein
MQDRRGSIVRRRHQLSVVALCALVIIAAACSSNDRSGNSFKGTSLTGAGATFPDPIYEQWFQQFRSVESDAKINYQAIGSGGGVEQFTKQTVDFGASDAPIQPDEATAIQKNGDFVEIPTVLGGVVMAYNVSGLQSGLKLDGKTVAGIFMGQIKLWNDPAIAGQNPGVDLPSQPISVVHRSDESGTTFVFTSWLSSQSSTWGKQVGADKAVQWPTGTGGDGNDGVAQELTQTEGAIGYLSYDFAVTSKLGIASIKRNDGTYVEPSIDSISAAGGILKFPISADTNILNSPATGAYPIASTTYLLIYKDQTNQDKGQTLVDLVYWGLRQGQSVAIQLNYAPLPQNIQTQALDLLSQITYNGSTIEPSPAVKS